MNLAENPARCDAARVGVAIEPFARGESGCLMPVANSASSHFRRRGKAWRKKLRRVAGPKPRHRKPAGVSAATKSNPHIETVVLNASARGSWLEVRQRQRGWRT